MRKDIDRILAKRGADGLLLYSESYLNPNMYYLTKFLTPDPFIFLKKVDSSPIILVNSMEFSRAKKESIVKDVRSFEDYGYSEVVKASKSPKIGVLKFLASVIEREIGKGIVICVPPDFPLIAANALRRKGLTIRPMFDVVEKARETKMPEEIKEITRVQRINEKVLAEVIELIKDCEVGANKTLMNPKKERTHLTMGYLKTFIAHKFLDNWCAIEKDIIVACGPQSSNPHFHGYMKSKIKANQPIVLDIYPRSIEKRYWSDMTRTIVKGKASKEVKRMFESVLDAKNVCIESLRAGVLGNEVYNICCDIFEKAGYNTLRGGKKIEKGFIHSLGHGVGLEIHEKPAMNEFNRTPLEKHSVVSVEPGLYNPKIGGVRIEDIVEITSRGYNNLTEMPVELEI